ncbi:Nucleolar protein 16 [Blastocladiella emersonii ATCC 22665]|nr:Nucleolar protein 16 [Blastocladiella emersonii ATCC 22665]
MTRPSARRKVRNPSLKVTRKTQQKHYKAKPVVHPIIAKAWDKKKTVKENYAAIGLALSVNSDHAAPKPVLEGDAATAAAAAAPAPTLITAGGKKIPLTDMAATLNPGVVVQAAKVRRAADGSVEGYDMDNLDAMDGGLDAVLQRAADAKPKSATVQELIKFARSGRGHFKLPSTGELDWLHALTEKHGEDVMAMVRDKKLNPYQHTPGQLRRKLNKYYNFLRTYEVDDVKALTA